MRKILRIAGLLPMAALLVFAQGTAPRGETTTPRGETTAPRVETWSGHLVDAGCAETTEMLSSSSIREGASGHWMESSAGNQQMHSVTPIVTGTRTYERDDVIATFTNDEDVRYARHEETWIQLDDTGTRTYDRPMTSSTGVSGSSILGGTTATTGTAARTDDLGGSAERSMSADTGRTNDACLVTSSTTRYGLRLDNGQVILIDPSGYAAVSSAIQSHQRWGPAVRAGGEHKLQTTVNGDLRNGNIHVITIDFE